MGVLRIGCIGAGGFARSVILPILRKQKDLALYCVATSTGVSSESARRAFQFERARTPSDLLRDPQTDLVFVLSRHDTHARYVLEALAQQKSVFVEKPLAINHAQLAEVQRAYEGQAASGHTPFLMVGFNRRFAPFSQRIQECFVNRREAMLVHIRVNAGYLSLDHWTQTPANGSRIVGEACHFVDWARWLVGRPIERVWASALPDGDRYNRDNVSIVLQFQGGSIANILYLANGDKSVAKEYFEVFCEGTVARLEDFEILELVRNGKIQRAKAPRDKGHRRELELTLQALRAGGTSPIPFEEIKDVTLATLAIEESLARARPVFLGTQVESVEASQRSREQDSNSLDSSRDPEGNSGRSFAGSL